MIALSRQACGHNRAYISLTVHFVASSMEMKNFCLMTKEVPEAHTAENLAEVLQQAIEEWNYLVKFMDNGRNMVNTVVDHLRVIYLPCIGHTIQLAVEKAFCLQDLASALGSVRKLVGYFRKLSKATYSLREKQRLLNLP